MATKWVLYDSSIDQLFVPTLFDSEQAAQEEIDPRMDAVFSIAVQVPDNAAPRSLCHFGKNGGVQEALCGSASSGTTDDPVAVTCPVCREQVGKSTGGNV